MNNIIFHCDLDCFFAAVEERDNPKLKGKPVIIGANPKFGRGVVCTCNYEARKYGLHSAMPISKAYKLCPHGIYLHPNSNKYSITSKNVMEIIKQYSPITEQVGIDEAYLDVSTICNNYIEAQKYAECLKKEIIKRVGITLSIGIGPTKSIAKIASDYNKPNGITVIEPNNIANFLKDLEINRIPGIGKKSKILYNKRGIYVIGDLMDLSLNKIRGKFGKHGEWIWKVINGYDNREVRENYEERKSISKERTFLENTNDFNLILSKLEEINEKIHNKLEEEQIFYRTITLKIRLEGFLTYTRSQSLPYPIFNKKQVIEIIIVLLREFIKRKKKVRLVGIKLSNLEKDYNNIQTKLIKYIEV